jgi:trehalose 6-phosphate synthase/phosphatase
MTLTALDEPTIELVAQSARAADELLLLLDYDGTLVPIVDRPELAAPDDVLMELIRAVAARPATTVDMVSGRPRETLGEWFADVPVGLWAEHGAFHRAAGTSVWKPLRPIPPGWEREVLPVLERFTADTPGSFVEQKTAGVAWHYRLADPTDGVQQAHALYATLSSMDTGEPISVIRGKKVVEVRLKGISKALAARQPHLARDRVVALAIGDDDTDDELFAALPPGSLTVAVGRRACAARYRVHDDGAVRSLLRRLLP